MAKRNMPAPGRAGTTKSIERRAKEREMTLGMKRLQAEDPAAFDDLVRLLARLSAEVATSQRAK